MSYHLFGRPDMDLDGFATSVRNDLVKAKLLGGDAPPLVIVCVSLGGVITRSIMNNHFEDNIKAIEFVTCPLWGSNLE